MKMRINLLLNFCEAKNYSIICIILFWRENNIVEILSWLSYIIEAKYNFSNWKKLCQFQFPFLNGFKKFLVVINYIVYLCWKSSKKLTISRKIKYNGFKLLSAKRLTTIVYTITTKQWLTKSINAILHPLVCCWLFVWSLSLVTRSQIFSSPCSYQIPSLFI